MHYTGGISKAENVQHVESVNDLCNTNKKTDEDTSTMPSVGVKVSRAENLNIRRLLL